MTDTTRNWYHHKHQGWSLSKTAKGRYQHWCLSDPQGNGVASILNTGYYPLSTIFDWAVNKIADLGVANGK